MRSNKDTVRNNIEDICGGDTVALLYEEYKNMKARIELLEVLAEAEDDAKNGRVAPISETFDDLRKMLQEE